MLDERITLPGYPGELRQMTVLDLGHEDPTVLLTNNFKLKPPTLVLGGLRFGRQADPDALARQQAARDPVRLTPSRANVRSLKYRGNRG